MNYIGSKLTLSSWIKNEIKDICGDDLKEKIFCDIFAGTGIMGRVFKSEVKKVISNDFEDYAYILNKNYIENHQILLNSHKFVEILNNL